MVAGERDLLRGFSGGLSTEEVTGGDSDEIELGLSLGGCFCPQEAEHNRLTRSSSIPDMLQSDLPAVAPIIRSCSLPSDTEEEIRRRKEMQSKKRMEAKRKREEKRSVKRFDEDFKGGSERKMKRFEVESLSIRFGLASQGSVASQGSSSSGGSEFESRPGQGFELPVIICASNAGAPSNVPTTSKRNNHKTSSAPTRTPEQTSKSINNSTHCHNGIMFDENASRKEGERSHNYRINDVGKNVMEEMPFVSTRGDGANGRRIEGFLYRYGKGEVSIVCVCHGSFLTPAEFVKHAGGGDVDHPLRHIVVNPSPGSLL